MQDIITIRDLHLRTIIGLNEWERNNKQDLMFNIEMLADLRAAGESDDIKDTVNYRTICKRVIEIVENSDYLLLEKLAAHLARVITIEYGVSQVTIEIDKPAALRFSRSVAIKVTRQREDFE